MTCIVGYSKKGKVIIGGDSAGVADYDIEIRNDEKVFKVGDMIFGFTSSFRMGQLLRFSLKKPKHPKGMDDYEYLCTLFVDALIKCFEDKGYITVKESTKSGGTFLIGYKGNLYTVYDDFQVAKSKAPYNSVGCGRAYALGALKCMSLLDTKLSPKKQVKKALEAAEHLSGGVQGPFHLVSL